jgi:hypothetical protein
MACGLRNYNPPTPGGHFCAQEAEARTSNPKIRRLIFVIRLKFVMKVLLSKVNFLHRCNQARTRARIYWTIARISRGWLAGGTWKRSAAVSIPLGISPEPRTSLSSKRLTKSPRELSACSPRSGFTISPRSLPTRSGWQSITKPGLPKLPLPPFASCACPGQLFTLG